MRSARRPPQGSERPADGDLEQAAWISSRPATTPKFPSTSVDLGLVYSLGIKPHQGAGSRSQRSNDTHGTGLWHGSDPRQRSAPEDLYRSTASPTRMLISFGIPLDAGPNQRGGQAEARHGLKRPPRAEEFFIGRRRRWVNP